MSAPTLEAQISALADHLGAMDSEARELAYDVQLADRSHAARDAFRFWQERVVELLRHAGLEEEARRHAPVTGLAASYGHRSVRDEILGAAESVRTLVQSLRAHPEHWMRKIAPRHHQSRSIDALARLHPMIQEAVGDRFRPPDYAAAIEAAFKAVNVAVRAKAGVATDGGTGMMLDLFSDKPSSPGKPRLRISDGGDQTGRDEQEGARFLFAGMQAAIRNPHAHEFRPVEDAAIALEYLSFASLLMRLLDRATPEA